MLLFFINLSCLSSPCVGLLGPKFRTCLSFQAHLVGVGEMIQPCAHGSRASREHGPAWRGSAPASSTAGGSGWSGCGGAAGSCCTFPWGELSLQRQGDNLYQCVSVWLHRYSCWGEKISLAVLQICADPKEGPVGTWGVHLQDGKLPSKAWCAPLSGEFGQGGCGWLG